MSADDGQRGPCGPDGTPGLRDLMEARRDGIGLHLCDLAEAREAAREGRSGDALAALSRALQRMAEAGSLAGLDVVAAEGLALARDAGDGDLEERLRGLVVRCGREDVLAAVLAGLWQASDRCLDGGDGPAALGRARAALDLAVGAGDPRAAAVALGVLAACHEAEGRLDAMALCLQQAGRCLRLSGRPDDALGLLETSEAAWEAAGRPDEAGEARDERLRVAESEGRPGVVVDLLCGGADEALARGEPRAAQRLARRALALAAEGADPALEAVAWRALARVHRAAGDEEGAVAAAARADLLEGAEGSEGDRGAGAPPG